MSDQSAPTPLSLPYDDAGWLAWLSDHCGGGLDQARHLVDALKGSPPSAPDRRLDAWNDVEIAMKRAASAGLVAQVHPDESVRSHAEDVVQAASRLATDLVLDRDLYRVFEQIDGRAGDLDDGAARTLSHTLRDFRRAGVNLDDATRERVRVIAERETALGQEISRNSRDSVLTVRLDPSQLRGLPPDYVQAHPVGSDGRVAITTDYPDVYPFLMFAEDATARREVMLAFNNRAWPENDPLLVELLALRAEQAQLLGYDSWPDYDAEVKMIGDGAAIARFIDEISAAAEDPGRRDRDVLLQRLRRDEPTAAAIDRADTTYYAELIRREQYAVDSQQVRTYFDFAKVRAGLLDITGRLFGLQYTAVDVAVWHDDVTAYDVSADGERLGRIYLDLHPRTGKYKHAAQFDLVTGIGGRQLPEGALVCNFPTGLMEHRDVVTLFHEFGHLVHHVLAGRQPWARFSGVATEWDFVEAPSQMLEEWAWSADVLRTFATNAEDEPIPAELVEKMRAADEFGKGYLARTQMFYAAVSYWLHRGQQPQPEGGDRDLTAEVRRLQSAYDLFPYIEGTHFHAAFGHLTGYSSAYYTYMWSLVIAKDMFSRFDPDNLLATDVARQYRDKVLAPGGSRDAADLVADFLGRPYSTAAFHRWLSEPPAAG